MITQNAFTSGRSLVGTILEKWLATTNGRKFFLLKRSFFLLLSMEVGCLTIIDVKQNTAYTMVQRKTEEDVQKNIQGKQ